MSLTSSPSDLLTNLVNTSNLFLNTLSNYLAWTFGLGLVLILIHCVNQFLLGKKLYIFGLLPRRLVGLPGIIFSPFLHQDFGHLIFNLIPLWMLTNLVLMMGWVAYVWVSLLLIFSSGLLLWLFGRSALHIGASGLIVAYWGFLLMSLSGGLSFQTILTIFVCLYYFGGLLFSILPTDRYVSWEGHLFGLISGLGLGYEWFHDHGHGLVLITQWFFK